MKKMPNEYNWQRKLSAGMLVLVLIPALASGDVARTYDKFGIRGQIGPELELKDWIDGNGNDRAPLRLSNLMRKYRSGGTPWTVIIDHKGTVVYNQFHIEVEQAAGLTEDLLQKRLTHLNEVKKDG